MSESMVGRKNINEWIKLLQKKVPSLISRLTSIYGPDQTLIDERLAAFLKVATKFQNIFGDRAISLVRVPGRLNTLGMHIDHRGGFINPIAINKEAVLCYAARDDDLLHVYNLDSSYGERKFNITRELPEVCIDSVTDWLSWTQDQTNKRKQRKTNKDWVNKLKSVPVYLQAIYPDKKLSGFEAVLDSNIPSGMGLSSSSAIVVGVMEAMLDINHISISDDEFVNYCGTSEWFVGTRGGSGDHAAIKFGRLGMVTHMKTLPRLMIKSYLPFPEGYKIIVFTSGITAEKSGQAQQKFNEKTATYEIGEIYIREYMETHHRNIFEKIINSRNYLAAQEKKFYLADVVECLSQSEIYKLFRSLPESIGRHELLEKFPGYEALLKEKFLTHLELEEGYQIRAVVMYGISECKRSSMLEEIIKEGNVKLFGKLMDISHDGDRVSFPSGDKKAIDTEEDLYLLPGGYGCSIPQIDEMVDAAKEAGALAARISGAGLGGSIMALVKDEDFKRLVETLNARYYILSPIQGAGRL